MVAFKLINNGIKKPGQALCQKAIPDKFIKILINGTIFFGAQR